MAENPTITSLQEAAKNAAAAAISEGKLPATKPTEQKPPPKKEGDAPPPPAGDTPDGMTDLAAHIKSKYGIDLKEDEILSRLKSSNGNGHDNPPPVRGKKAKPEKQDITDEAVKVFLASQKKENLLDAYEANKKKDDVTIMKEFNRDRMKEQFPDITDEKADSLFNERYFIAEEGEDDPYEDDEKQFGQHMLKQDAERLRNQTGFQIDSVRDLLYSDALNDYQNTMFADAVDDFMKTVPEKMTMQLGKSGAIDLGEFNADLERETIQTVAGILKNPVSLLDEFRDKDEKTGKLSEALNLQKMYDFMLKGKLFDNIVKSTAVDYYSRGVESISNRLHNAPDLNKIRPPEKKNTKKEEVEKAQKYNEQQIGANIGRGRVS